MSEGPVPGGFFGFIDILHGLPIVPKIIMFIGLMALIAGFLSGRFSLIQNPKISAGAGLMIAALGWREWERVPSRISRPNHRSRWNFGPLVKGVLYMGVAAVLFWRCYLVS
jgi:hypothetical protein